MMAVLLFSVFIEWATLVIIFAVSVVYDLTQKRNITLSSFAKSIHSVNSLIIITLIVILVKNRNYN